MDSRRVDSVRLTLHRYPAKVSSTPICIFILKCHPLSFLAWRISGSSFASLFLVKVGADILVASTMLASLSSVPSRLRLTVVRQCQSDTGDWHIYLHSQRQYTLHQP